MVAKVTRCRTYYHSHLTVNLNVTNGKLFIACAMHKQ